MDHLRVLSFKLINRRTTEGSVIKYLSNVLIPHLAASLDHNKGPMIQNNGKICIYCQVEK